MESDGVTRSALGDPEVAMETSNDPFLLPQPPGDLPMAMEVTPTGSLSRSESLKSVDTGSVIAMETEQASSDCDALSAESTLVENPSPDLTSPPQYLGGNPQVGFPISIIL